MIHACKVREVFLIRKVEGETGLESLVNHLLSVGWGLEELEIETFDVPEFGDTTYRVTGTSTTCDCTPRGL